MDIGYCLENILRGDKGVDGEKDSRKSVLSGQIDDEED